MTTNTAHATTDQLSTELSANHAVITKALATSLPATILHTLQAPPKRQRAVYFAPSNIALIKYWGKRDLPLRLPHTNSLSMSLGNLGARVDLQVISLASKTSPHRQHTCCDSIYMQHTALKLTDGIAARTIAWLNQLLGYQRPSFKISVQLNIPLGAGLASSACWFAALSGALCKLYTLPDNLVAQSIIARIGSGSACRSVASGWVEWQAGIKADGSDSHAICQHYPTPDLRIGILWLDKTAKKINSTDAMQHCQRTSPLYRNWAQLSTQQLQDFKAAVACNDFTNYAAIAEANACLMHDTIVASNPSIDYSTHATYKARQQVRRLRKHGLPVYFTQDAGPNLKLLYRAEDSATLQQHWPDMSVVNPYATDNCEKNREYKT